MKPGRRLTLVRRLVYGLLTPVGTLLIRLLWSSCKIDPIAGDSALLKYIDTPHKPVIFCYWHRLQIFCVHYVLNIQKRGLPLSFLISPSVDGEIPAKIAKKWGASVVRASTTRTGAKAIRDVFHIIRDGKSPVTSSDGPSGPIFKFKPGAILLAQFSKVPIIPLSYAAERAWRLKTWDRFLIPKPFSRIKIVVGQPRYIHNRLSLEQIKQTQEELEMVMRELYLQAKQALAEETDSSDE